MGMIDRRGRTLSLVAWLVGFALMSGAGAQDVTLKLHHFLPPQAIGHSQFLAPWAKRIETQSDGRIRVDIYPAMQLGGKPPQLYDQVRDGVVDLVWTVPSYTPGRFPKLEVFELPFVTASATATSQAVMAYADTYLRGQFDGVRPLVFHVHAPGVLHMNGRPITRLADLAGAKLRTPNRSITATLRQLGAVPVGMPAPQVPQAIARGVVDGTVFPYEVTLPLRIHEITDSHTAVFDRRGLYTTVIMLAMNQASYDSLPPDLQAVIDANAGMAVAADVGRIFDQAEEPGRAAAAARGNRFIDLDRGEVARWREASQPVIDRWVADIGADGADLLAARLAAGRKSGRGHPHPVSRRGVWRRRRSDRDHGADGGERGAARGHRATDPGRFRVG